MPVPNYPAKHDADAVLSPTAHVEHHGVGSVGPRAAILTYQRPFFESVVERQRLDPLESWAIYEVYPLAGTDGEGVIVGDIGVGGPATAIAAETLIARGVEAICILGGCGGIGDALAADEAVIADRAVRDDGVSHHYLPDARYVEADDRLLAALHRELRAADQPTRTAGTWTTAALFRETGPEIDHYAGEGVASVEMEAASLYAVAAYRDTAAAAVLVPNDHLRADEWVPPVDQTSWLQALFDPVREAVMALD